MKTKLIIIGMMLSAFAYSQCVIESEWSKKIINKFKKNDLVLKLNENTYLFYKKAPKHKYDSDFYEDASFLVLNDVGYRDYSFYKAPLVQHYLRSRSIIMSDYEFKRYNGTCNDFGLDSSYKENKIMKYNYSSINDNSKTFVYNISRSKSFKFMNNLLIIGDSLEERGDLSIFKHAMIIDNEGGHYSSVTKADVITVYNLQSSIKYKGNIIEKLNNKNEIYVSEDLNVQLISKIYDKRDRKDELSIIYNDDGSVLAEE